MNIVYNRTLQIGLFILAAPNLSEINEEELLLGEIETR